MYLNLFSIMQISAENMKESDSGSMFITGQINGDYPRWLRRLFHILLLAEVRPKPTVCVWYRPIAKKQW